MANEKIHPWRMCALGKHWVKPHKRRIKSKTTNKYKTINVSGFCRLNSSKKDQLYKDELDAIARKYFENRDKLTSIKNLDYASGDLFDDLISGWVEYWNEVLSPETELDPNLVKALIATESSFDKNAKKLASKNNWARGLLQITDQTIIILKNENGELRDFLVNINQQNSTIPNLNICAGIRWLFHKQKLASSKLKRNASWFEAVLEYKSFTKKYKEKDLKAIEQMNKFSDLYDKLKK